MDDMKMKEGVYKRDKKSQGEKHDTFQDGKGTMLVLILNEPDDFWLTRYPPGDGIKNGQTFKLLKAQEKDVFKIVDAEENLFLEVYKDRIEIRSE